MKAIIRDNGLIVNIIDVPDGADLSTFGAEPFTEGDVIDSSVRQKAKQEDRRSKRNAKFATTIDRMNPVWYNSLDSTQQSNLATWRQQWLDYPSTGIIPNEALVQDIF